VLVVVALVLELDQEARAQVEDNPLSLEIGNMQNLLTQKGKRIHRGSRNCQRNQC